MTFRVLFVDDNPDVRDILRLQLSFVEGLSVALASNGREGLEKFKEVSPDLVVLDYLMPGYTGLELAQLLRDEGYAGPIILYSSASFLLDDEQLRKLALQVFEKVEWKRLVEKIKSIFEASSNE